MKRFFQYFGFNQTEQKGFIVLCVIIIGVLFVPFFIKSNLPDDSKPYELVYFESSKSGDNDSHLALNDYSGLEKVSINTSNSKEVKYFKFDPNNLDEESWAQLGFSKKQIRVIKNYEAKGGKFYRKEDVAKIYAISANDYKRIEPYIYINKPKFETRNTLTKDEIKDKFSNHNVKKNAILNINIADTTDWKSLTGIGSAYARRIVNYREALGGFYAVEQISEVYGLTSETFEKIRPYLQIENSSKVRKLNVNTISVDFLAKHPYISKKQAQTIVNYRMQHGSFTQLESLLEIQSLDREFLRKIEPYLEF